MLKYLRTTKFEKVFVAFLVVFLLGALNISSAQAQITAFKQSVAEAASDDEDLSAFYRENGFEPVWTGSDPQHRERRAELFRALDTVELHGLSAARFDAAA